MSDTDDTDLYRGDDHDPVCPPGFKPYGKSRCHICAIINAARASERENIAKMTRTTVLS